jgi:hypothetical protein
MANGMYKKVEADIVEPERIKVRESHLLEFFSIMLLSFLWMIHELS